MAAILPLQPSTKEVLNNPNSLNNLMKISYEQQKQAASDTAYDTKTNIYENFEVKEVDPISVAVSFMIAAGVLGSLLFISKLLLRK